MEHLPKNIALVYDRVNKWGGAERVLLTLNKLFPGAPLFTTVYDSEKATWAKVFPEVIPSFLQKLPLAQKKHEFFAWATPLATETLNLKNFDLVISITSADAKALITSPRTLHICYCLTPTRYLWSHADHYQNQLPAFFKPIFNYLKKWDLVASSRPDVYIAISKTVSERIKKYYNRNSSIISPPVETQKFLVKTQRKEGFFLWVGRFVSYKQPEMVARVFTELDIPLVMVGTGSLQKNLKSKYKNISFLGSVPDQQLRLLYGAANALIMFHEEDFGLVAIEAMSAGTPVITISKGGGSETIVNRKTGIIAKGSTSQDLINALHEFKSYKWNSKTIQNHAKKFSSTSFSKKFLKTISAHYKEFKSS